MSLLKKLLLISTAFFFIILLVIASIPLWFDINDYKATLISQFEQQTGRKMEIPGKLSLSVFPQLAVKTGKISIGNAKNFGKQPFAQLEQLQLGVKLIPLFSQRIEAEQIVISGLEVNLARNAQGQSNWDDLAAPGKTTAPKPETPTQKTPAKSATPSLPEFGLAGIRIENARLNWQDKQAGQTWQAQLKQLHLGAVGFDSAIPISAELTATDTHQFNLSLNADGQFSINPLLSKLSIPELKLDASIEHPSLVKAVKPSLTLSKLSFDISKQKLDLPGLRLVFEDTQLQGSLKAALSPAIKLDYKLDIDQLDVDKLLALLAEEKTTAKKTTAEKNALPPAAIPFAAMTAIPANGSIKLGKMTVMKTHWNNIEAQTHASKGQLQLKPLKLSGYGTTINGDTSIDARQDTPSVQANLAMNGLQVSPLLKDMLAKDNWHGEANVKATLNTHGHTVAKLKQQLAGQVSLSLDKGIYKGVDAYHELRTVEAKFKGDPPPPKPADPQTELATVTATGVINQGILSNQDLRASTPLGRYAGSGKIDIARETIDYMLLVKFTSSGRVAEGTTYEQLDRVPLEIPIKGPWQTAKPDPQYEKYLKNIFKKKLEPKKQEVKKKIDEKLEKKKQEVSDKVKDKLKRLLK